MEANILDILGLQLIDYFLNFEGYQPFILPENLRNQNHDKIYLINKNHNKYPVIVIIKAKNLDNLKMTNDNKIIKLIEKNLEPAVTNHIFKILLNNNSQNELVESQVTTTLVATPAKIINSLENFFPKITSKIKNEYSDEEDNNLNNDSNLSPRQMIWKKVNYQNRHFLKKAFLSSSSENVKVTWFLIFLSLTFYTFFIFFNLNLENLIDEQLGKNNYDSIKKYNYMKLFLGAVTRNLVYSSDQYWRWLTYPLVIIDFFGLLCVFMFYKVGRFVEGFYGSVKASIIWVAGVILTGVLYVSVTDKTILSGFLPLIFISIGALIPIVWNYKLFKSKMMLQIIIVFMIICFFTLQQESNFVVIVIAITSGWLIAATITYHEKNTFFYFFSPIAIIILLAFALVSRFLLCYAKLDYDNNTQITLKMYKSLNLLSQDFIDNVKNYFDYFVVW